MYALSPRVGAAQGHGRAAKRMPQVQVSILEQAPQKRAQGVLIAL